MLSAEVGGECVKGSKAWPHPLRSQSPGGRRAGAGLSMGMAGISGGSVLVPTKGGGATRSPGHIVWARAST